MDRKPCKSDQSDKVSEASTASCLSRTSTSVSEDSIPAKLDLPSDFEILSKPLFRIPQHLLRNPLQNAKQKSKKTPSMLSQERRDRSNSLVTSNYFAFNIIITKFTL